MKPWVWLRIAAVLQALGIVGHNLATLSTKPMHGPAEQAVFDAMRGFQFNIMGSTRSNWDFYRGYQFMTTVNFALILVMLWMLSNWSRRAPREARPLVLAILIAQIFFVVIAWEFFFAGPGVVGGLLALCIAMAAFELYHADQQVLRTRQSVSA
jgi:peptidoglycan/LPS O-acetylase OafA/YrhL